MKQLLAALLLSAATIGSAAAQTSDCIWADQENHRQDPGTEVTVAFHHGLGEGPSNESGDPCNRDVPPGPSEPLQVDVEVTGSNDPDGSNSPETPDLTCELQAESAASCSVSYVGSGAGVDELRAWIDADRNDTTDERDDSEGAFEGSQPGEFAEPDGTEVRSVNWRFPECRDGIDNDGDGSVDYPSDSDCETADEDSELRVVCGPCAPPVCRAGEYPNMIVGTAGADILIGTARADCVVGFGGDDLIKGRGGSDLLLGNGGVDQIFGGRGRDHLRGNRHADLLWGGNGDDIMRGNEGSDSLSGDGGEDTLFGGDGRDHCSGELIRGCP